jgi:heme-degrading monooxygenase HmoA
MAEAFFPDFFVVGCVWRHARRGACTLQFVFQGGSPAFWRANCGDLIVILEIADIRVTPGTQAEFEAAIERGAKEVISKARGFAGYKINKGVESPERYVLMIFWQTLENHTLDFRQSPAFQEWRALVGPYFAGPPQVEHFELLSKSA